MTSALTECVFVLPLPHSPWMSVGICAAEEMHVGGVEIGHNSLVQNVWGGGREGNYQRCDDSGKIRVGHQQVPCGVSGQLRIGGSERDTAASSLRSLCISACISERRLARTSAST